MRDRETTLANDGDNDDLFESYVMPNDTYQWQPPPSAELQRLAKLLAGHLRKAAMPDGERTLAKCVNVVRKILEKQRETCFLAGGDDRYCWNHPKDRNIAYLKLEWGHKVPRSQDGTNDLSNLILVCARCNNHIQTSRTLRQLIPELEHKLAVLRNILLDSSDDGGNKSAAASLPAETKAPAPRRV